MAATGDGLGSKDLQTMISDRNETAEMMVKRVWPRVDSWKVQWSKKLTSMRFKVRWHDDSPKGTITLLEIMVCRSLLSYIKVADPHEAPQLRQQGR